MRRPHYQTTVLGLGLLFCCMALLAFPQEISNCVQQSLQIYISALFSALFPFFVMTSLFVDLGFSQWLGCFLSPVMTHVFHLHGNCSSALALGLIGGYPAGANATVALYKNGQCTKHEAQCLLAFCNNCGPAFFLGLVGGTLFQDFRAGLFLYLIHVLSALLVGGLLCRSRLTASVTLQHSSPVFQSVSFPVALIRAITNAFQSLLNICAFFLFFSIILRILSLSGLTTFLIHGFTYILPNQHQPLQALLSGLLEITAGIASLSQSSSLSRYLITSFLLGWGGCSVHFQTLSLLADTDLSVTLYFIGKSLHALTALLLTAVLLLPPCRLPLSIFLSILWFLLGWRKKAVENSREIYYNGDN